jgi:hypothetical protein
MKKLDKLKKHQKAAKPNKFNKKLLKIIPELKPYVRHRLYIACSLDIIPENMYQATGIINDSIIKLYESDLSQFESKVALRLELFKLAKEELEKVFIKESWHQQNISTDKILHQELNKLKEKFTFNADEDFIMNEELTDISYKQKDISKQLFLYENSEASVLSTFNFDEMNEKRRATFSQLYRLLSMEASNVVDLHVFGKLTPQEIASIKGVKEATIIAIIDEVKDRISYSMGLLKE